MNADRKILELLAPARDEECARAAITHGADAVYIGAPAFGARRDAANSIDVIKRVVEMAHTYGVRVYAALNTLLFDKEVDEAVSLAWQLHEASVDALIVQDCALLENDRMPPVALHASTQLSNGSAEKVLFWQKLGIEQVVLDRELTEAEIRQIAQRTDVRLEAFVHGALCVSYSGRCFMSQTLCGRSANRGDCAQPCRQTYTLVGANGKILAKDKYLLSMRDLNRSQDIEAMIDAGVSAFKIEGRLKGPEYVANITLLYSQILDDIVSRRPDLRRVSSGKVQAGFVPDAFKSFNRGFTTYFFHGRQGEVWQPETPKSLGEYIGRVGKVGRNAFEVKSQIELSNGDGLYYIGANDRADGVKANKVERIGPVQRVSPLKMNGISEGARLYRNSSAKFTALMKSDTTRRVIRIDLELSANGNGEYTLRLKDEEGIVSEQTRGLSTTVAENSEGTRRMLESQLRKMGGTPYLAENVTVNDSATRFFVSSAEINGLRRDALERHTKLRIERHRPPEVRPIGNSEPFVVRTMGREGNVLNQAARDFYLRHGTEITEWGYERQSDTRGNVVMTTRHCLLNSLGLCVRHNRQSHELLPLTLRHENVTYEVTVDCGRCQMTIKKI